MSRDEVIAQLAKVFRQYGYEGATLARLSEATGLGKASLYHYFPKGKEQMAAGESKDLFHAQIQQALNTWIDTLAQVLIEAGLDQSRARHRAEDAILQIQGSLVLARGLDDTTPFKRVLQRLAEELLNA